MATIRVTVTFADSVPPPTQVGLLADLAARLRASLTGDQRLTRLAGLSLPGAAQGDRSEGLRALGPDGDGPGVGRPPDRIFKLEMPDGEDGMAFLRSLGGWHMGSPAAQLSLKVDGPGGGVSLRMDGWSAVAFAAAVARIHEHLS